MTDTHSIGKAGATPKWFWVIAGIFIIWNLIGAANYLGAAYATPETLADSGYTAEQAAFLLDMPAHYMAVFALAVWSGLAASILFILRKRLAVPVFIFSAVMVVVSFILDVTGGTFTVLGNGYMAMMCVVVALAIIEVFVARKAHSRAILR